MANSTGKSEPYVQKWTSNDLQEEEHWFEGDENGKVKYGGGWLTTKYYIQQAQNKVHGAAEKVIPFQEIPTPDLDGVAFKVGNADDFSKILIFILL